MRVDTSPWGAAGALPRVGAAVSVSAMRALCGIAGALFGVACSHDNVPQFVSSNPFVLGERQVVPAMTVAGDQVFWGVYVPRTDVCDGALYVAPKSGGRAHEVATGCIISVIADGADVYWAEEAPGESPVPGAIHFLGSGAAGPVTLASATNVFGLAKRGPLLYAALYDATMSSTSLAVIPNDGGPPHSLITDAGDFFPFIPLVADETGLSWFRPLYNSAYLMHFAPSAVAAQQLATLVNPGGLVSISGALWYLDSPYQADAGSLLRIGGANSSPEKVLQTGGMPQALTGDSMSLYWVEDAAAQGDGGVLVRAPLDGGSPSVLARTSTPLLQALALDNDWIYFATQGEIGDEIWRVRRQ